MQPRGAVVENQLKDGLGVLLEPLDAEGDDRAPRRRRLAELQFGNGPELAAVLVAPRPMQQQVFDGANLQPRQLRRAFRADAGQRGHRSGEGRDRLIGRRGGHPASTIRGETRNPKPEIILREAWLPFAHELLQRREQRRRIRQVRGFAPSSHQAETRAIGRAIRDARIRAAFGDLLFRQANHAGAVALHFIFPAHEPRRGETIRAVRR